MSRPTQDEIDRVVGYLVGKNCAEGGHAPTQHVATHADPVGFHHCDCGEITWTPEQAEVTD